MFSETKLGGAFVINLDRKQDKRGFFARAFCQHEFEEYGLEPVIAQANIAFNRRRATMRGMHFQFPPATETKLLRCTRGAILDIIVDFRPESPTYLDHVAVELSADNHRALYVPAASRTGTRSSRTSRRRATRSGSSTPRAMKMACAMTIRAWASAGSCR
jgi:dTDP-4-dehydrorhamnose 3,5-epimerase